MKKYLLILFVVVAGLSSCSKDSDDTFDTAAQAATDDASIQAYLKANNITTAVHDPTGLYYQIVTPGTGAYPTAASTATVNYTGKLLNGTQFDTGTAFVANLATGVITGWRIGVPHINTGGRIILFVPSGMAYGNTATGSIPKNSVLIFTIDLISFK
jgi:FKBP-type peptidyl-prolyl cis-trans isomerase FkpA